MNELEDHVGDILAAGMVRKAVQKIGGSAEEVTPSQMSQALRVHIAPSLLSFMSPDMSKQVIRGIEKRIQGVS